MRPPAAVAAPRASLRARLSLWLALQTMLGLGLVCAAVYVVIALTLSRRQDETLAQKQATVEHLLAEGRGSHTAAELHHLLDDVLAGHDELSLRLLDAQGQPVYEKPSHAALQARGGKRRGFAPSLSAAPGGRLQAELLLDQRPDQALLQRLAWTLALASLIGTLAVSAGGFLLVRLGLSPLHMLVDQTRRVSATELGRRLDGRGQAQELQPLIEQFNALLDRLSGAYRQMEAFNADVAHELNTPLATLISSCELALRKPRGAEELREALASNLEDLRRMAAIIGDMLFLSHAERGLPARRTPVPSLAALAAEVIEFHEAALQEAGLRVELRGDAAAAVDARLLRRALSNLLGNATRYATPGSALQICIEARAGDGAGERVSLAVQNQGPTIAPEHLPRLFDRFYRADAARAQADRNHGLGLSIVAAIARMHGGEVFAESTDGRSRIGFVLEGGPRVEVAA